MDGEEKSYWASALLKSYSRNSKEFEASFSGDKCDAEAASSAPKLTDMLLHKSPYRIPTPPKFAQDFRKSASSGNCEGSCITLKHRRFSAPILSNFCTCVSSPLVSEEELHATNALSKPLGDLAKFVNDQSHAVAQKSFPERVQEAIPDFFDPLPSKVPKFDLFCAKYAYGSETKWRTSKRKYRKPVVMTRSAPDSPLDWISDDFLNEVDNLIRPTVPVDSYVYLRGISHFDL